MLDGSPLTIFPPGMAVVAAIGELVVGSGETMSRVIGAVSFFAIVVLSERLLRRVVSDRAVLLGTTALVAVSPALLGVSKMAWSEAPFIVVCLASLLLLGQVSHHREAAMWELGCLVLLCWLAFSLRYAGVSLIAFGAVVLTFSLQRGGWRVVLMQVGAFVALASSIPVGWMLRNHAIDGTYLGARETSPDTLLDGAYRIAGTLGEWILPSAHGDLPPALAAAVGFVGGILAAGLVIHSMKGQSDRGAECAGEFQATRLAFVYTSLTFVVVYCIYLVVAQLSTAFDPIGPRLLSPVYVPIVALAAIGIEGALTDLQEFRHHLRATGSTVLIVFILGQSIVSVGHMYDGIINGIGYNSRSWADSELAVAVTALEEVGTAAIYSNSPSGLWSATGIQPLLSSPRRFSARGAPIADALDDFRREVSCTDRPVYLALYDRGDVGLYTAGELRDVIDLSAVSDTGDGVLFLVEQPADRGEPPSCAEP